MENHAKHQYGQACPICNEAESVGVIKLPHNDELERAVLGELIVDTPALYVTMDTLNKALFYNMAHKLIFEAIQNLFNNSRAVDMLTVVDELRKEGILEQVGGIEYISRLSDNVVSGAHIQTHIAILMEKYVHRELIRTAAGLLKDASDETCNSYMLLDKGVWSLEKIVESIPQKRTITLDDALCEVAEEIHSVWEQEYHGIPSGFTSLDMKTNGFQPGTLIVLASKPAIGKTSFALSMARNIACEFCYPVAFISLQIKETGLASRLISQEMGIPQSHLKNSKILTDEKKRLIEKKIMELQETPLYIDDADRINVSQLRCSCKRLIHEHNVRMIIIDGLPQIYVPAEETPSHIRKKEIGFLSRKLKSMSQELNVPILVTTNFDHKTDEIPTLSNLQESGCIDEVADIVIGLQITEQDERSKNTDVKASLQIMKNKDGELGVVDLRFDRNSMKFYDPSTPPAKKNKTNKKVCNTSVKVKHEDTIDTLELPF